MATIYGIPPVLVPPANQAQPFQPPPSADTKAETALAVAAVSSAGASSGASSSTTPDANTGGSNPQATADRDIKPKAPPSQDTKATQTPKMQAESQVAASARTAETDESVSNLSPESLAKARAEELAEVRETFERYREFKAREEAFEGFRNNFRKDESGEQMDVRMPLVDEIPDRPLPRIGMPAA